MIVPLSEKIRMVAGIIDGIKINDSKSCVKKVASEKAKTWKEIQKEYDKKFGENHHCLKLECIKCGNHQTCRCSTPKISEKGICYDCELAN